MQHCCEHAHSYALANKHGCSLSMCMQRETKNANNFENVYVLEELEEPSARSIRNLDDMMGEDSPIEIAICCMPAQPSCACWLACAQPLGWRQNAGVLRSHGPSLHMHAWTEHG